MPNASVSVRGMFPGGNTGQGGLTAFAGGGQASATQLPALCNEVSTVASAADSVKLPSAIPGAVVFVNNAGANSMQVFGQSSNAARTDDQTTGDTIMTAASSAAAATATGVAQAAATAAVYFCVNIGVWKQGLLLT